MLRKVTSFFDQSLGFLGKDTSSYENACRLRDRLAQLVQDVSTVPNMCRHRNGADDDQDLGNLIMACFEGMDVTMVGTDPCEFRRMCYEVHRLECIFTFPWEDYPVDGDIRRREMHLDLNFYEKATATPFYKFQSWFSVNFTGQVYIEHFGPWPEVKTSSKPPSET